jgi:hypothetical protein
MPIDRGAIDAQLREIGEGDRWWEVREFRDLIHILHPDERLRGIIRGKLLGPRRPRVRPAGQWLVVATTTRLLCLRQDRFARSQVEVPAGQVLRMRSAGRLRGWQIAFETPAQRFRLRVDKADAFRFAGALAALMPTAPAQPLELDARTAALLPGAAPALPGVGGLLGRLVKRPAPDAAPRDQLERLEGVVERLQGDVERLQQHVAFLEDLLRRQSDVPFLARTPADR